MQLFSEVYCLFSLHLCGFAIVGYQLKAFPRSFAGTNFRAMEDGVWKKAEAVWRDV